MSSPIYLQPNIIRFVSVRVLVTSALMIQAVALGWFVYDKTGSALSLGLIGLVQFVPAIPLLTVAGYAADHFDRRKVVMISQTVQACGALGLYACVHWYTTIWPVYAMVVIIGSARSFALPSTGSLLPTLVPRELFPQTVAFSSSSMQFAAMVGPAIGGFAYAALDKEIFLLLAALPLIAASLMYTVEAPSAPRQGDSASPLRKAFAGLAYVRANRIVLGAISLDLFAVLLGGVTSLLPIFARDILHVGPGALGVLRSGPTLGGLLVGIALTQLPIRRRAGATMMAAVAGYGVATIVFALSSDFWLSMLALLTLGGCDMISIVVRQTLVQIATPDAMRGRVSAVSSIFVGASNQLGSFESGLVASLLGVVPAAVVGGIGTLVVVGAACALFPELRNVDRPQGEPDASLAEEAEEESLQKA
jgi:MFS family permease